MLERESIEFLCRRNGVAPEAIRVDDAHCVIIEGVMPGTDQWGEFFAGHLRAVEYAAHCERQCHEEAAAS